MARVEAVHSTRTLGRVSFGGAATGNGAFKTRIDARLAFVWVERSDRALPNNCVRAVAPSGAGISVRGASFQAVGPSRAVRAGFDARLAFVWVERAGRALPNNCVRAVAPSGAGVTVRGASFQAVGPGRAVHAGVDARPASIWIESSGGAQVLSCVPHRAVAT